MSDLDLDLDALVRRLRRKPIFPEIGGHGVSYGTEAVELMIPHRPPMRLVDGIDAFDPEAATIAAQRYVDPADPVFGGHFPGNPVYPGVLQLEMIGQAGLCLSWLMEHGALDPANPAPPVDVRVTRVHAASFLAPVLPGDRLTIACERVIDDPLCGVIAGQIRRGDTICSTCVIEVYFV